MTDAARLWKRNKISGIIRSITCMFVGNSGILLSACFGVVVVLKPQMIYLIKALMQRMFLLLLVRPGIPGRMFPFPFMPTCMIFTARYGDSFFWIFFNVSFCQSDWASPAFFSYSFRFSYQTESSMFNILGLNNSFGCPAVAIFFTGKSFEMIMLLLLFLLFVAGE